MSGVPVPVPPDKVKRERSPLSKAASRLAAAAVAKKKASEKWLKAVDFSNAAKEMFDAAQKEENEAIAEFNQLRTNS